MKDLTEQIEHEKDKTWMNKKIRSREIVSEILRFGVSQAHIVHIINLLALELEDREMMLAIREITSEEEETDDVIPQILHPGGQKDE
jgi:uncharacterized membrane protein